MRLALGPRNGVLTVGASRCTHVKRVLGIQALHSAAVALQLGGCANDVAAVPNGCYRAQREHSAREHLMIYVTVLRARIYVVNLGTLRY